MRVGGGRGRGGTLTVALALIPTFNLTTDSFVCFLGCFFEGSEGEISVKGPAEEADARFKTKDNK